MPHPDFPRSFYQHRLDPPEALTAALRFVPLVADGLAEPAECVDAVTAVFPAHNVDPHGYRARLCHALADAASDLQMRRNRAAGLIRAMCWPLMDQRATPRTYLARADEINRQQGSPLPDVRAVVNEVAEQWLRRYRSQRHGR